MKTLRLISNSQIIKKKLYHFSSSIVRYSLFISLFLINLPNIFSQQTDRSWSLNGYVKDMQTIIFTDPSENWITDNMIHNRLNFNWDIHNNFKLNLEMRNRFIWGELINMESYTPDSLLLFKYSDYIDNETGFLDVSANLLHEKLFILHSALDRFYLDYSYKDFQVTIGRQRINWGQCFVWNPNDLFNTYSFFDFDYEEKPGSDALRIQYYTGMTSHAELAIKADSEERITAAALYHFNKWNYDFQFLSGILNETDYVLGAGWSGQILKGGFLGEISYFHPKDNFVDTTGILTASLGYNYVFKNSMMLQFEAIYNSNGRTNSGFNLTEFYYHPVTAKGLTLNKFTVFSMLSYPVTPLVNTTFSAMYSPNDKSLFFGPAIDISLSQNLDLNVSGQGFISEIKASEGGGGGFVFLRFKYSF